MVKVRRNGWFTSLHVAKSTYNSIYELEVMKVSTYSHLTENQMCIRDRGKAYYGILNIPYGAKLGHYNIFAEIPTPSLACLLYTSHANPI